MESGELRVSTFFFFFFGYIYLFIYLFNFLSVCPRPQGGAGRGGDTSRDGDEQVSGEGLDKDWRMTDVNASERRWKDERRKREMETEMETEAGREAGRE